MAMPQDFLLIFLVSAHNPVLSVWWIVNPLVNGLLVLKCCNHFIDQIDLQCGLGLHPEPVVIMIKIIIGQQ